MTGSIESSRIVKALLTHVPGTFVKDYSGNKGWITVMRGEMTIHDHWKDTDKFTTGVPAETLCALPRGNVTAPTLYDGPRLVRPGWRVQLRRARAFMSDTQARRVEQELRTRVFT